MRTNCSLDTFWLFIWPGPWFEPGSETSCAPPSPPSYVRVSRTLFRASVWFFQKFKTMGRNSLVRWWSAQIWYCTLPVPSHGLCPQSLRKIGPKTWNLKQIKKCLRLVKSENFFFFVYYCKKQIVISNRNKLFQVPPFLQSVDFDFRFDIKDWFCITMRTNLPKLWDLLIFCIQSLNFSLEFFIMFFCNKSAEY